MQITLTCPDDWHLHLRDGAEMAAALPHSARRFARAVVMPNLDPPLTTVDAVLAYRTRILSALPAETAFDPLMTLYLTDATTPEEIGRARDSGRIIGAKLYPAGATTHSAAGVRDIERILPALAALEENGLALLVHAETTDPEVDVFDRERVFIERVLAPLHARFPALRLVLEHVTTREGVEFVRGASGRVAATVTAHHLLLNRNALFAGGLRPHHYCLPVLKRETHRRALIEAVASGDPRFFLGTDSAPHPRGAKEAACGCAGIFTAPAAIELYAEAFEAAGALDRLEAFAAFHGPDFHGLPRNAGTLTLVREPWEVPADYPLGAARVVALRAGAAVAWRIYDPERGAGLR